MRPKILHITSWFNETDTGTDAIFVKNHIAALSPFCDNDVLHIKFEKSISKFLKTERSKPLGNNSFTFERAVVGILSGRWLEIEYRVFHFIRKFLKKNEANYDVVNFYIAYPNAIRINYFNKKYPKIKFTITEHWSAYRGNFNLSPYSKGRARIAKIFDYGNDLIVVSDALGKDIQRFTEKKTPYKIVPNILETKIFSFSEQTLSLPFKMVSINFWTAMKNPFVLIDAVEKLVFEGEQVHLTLGGEGYLFDDIRKYITQKKLESVITLTGNLSRLEVAKLLAESHVYLQSSNYETFSVICLEALATGRPVIAHNVGGMREFINRENGILVNDLKTESWVVAIKSMILNYTHYKMGEVATEVLQKYSAEKVGKLFFEALTKPSESK